MSDALALLDAAAARVSSMLMPDGLHTLISFLRGEAFEEISPLLQIPNVLISCYNYTPLAIAADASLVSLSSSGERSALVQTFERYEFRVFVVNFMPESSSSAMEDVIPQKGHSSSNNNHSNSNNNNNSHNSGNIIRMKCMESVQAWCDGVYGKETQSVLLEHSHGNINPKRVRYEEGTTTNTTTTTTTTINTTNTNTINNTNSSNNTMKDNTCTQRVLFIIRCCADANSARSGAERSRRARDPLLLLLHDISATAALCRAREEHTHHTHLRFSVLLLPDDLAYGGALLEESLKAPLARDYCVRLFRGSTVQLKDAEQTAFLRQLEVWIGATPNMNVNGMDNNSSMHNNTTISVANGEEKEEKENNNNNNRESGVGEDIRRRSSQLFFIRSDNLPLCCFLRESLRRFPIILHPTALRQLQTLWAARHQLGDVVAGFHTLLCPFTLSSSRYNTSIKSISISTKTKTKTKRTKERTTRTRRTEMEVESESESESESERDDGITQLTDSVDLINALLVAAGQWADGHILNEAVAFAVLYEDLVYKRSTRLQRVPSFMLTLQQLWEKRTTTIIKINNSRRKKTTTTTKEMKKSLDDGVMTVEEALRLCVPVYTPSCLVQDASYQQEEEEKEKEKEKEKKDNDKENENKKENKKEKDNERCVAVLPAVMMAPAARMSIVGELMRAALLAVLPPHDSLEELKTAVHNSNNNHNNNNNNSNNNHNNKDVDMDSTIRTTGNNFFTPSLPHSARILHILTVHALSHSTLRRKFVSFAVLQRVCQLTDEALVRALKELQLAGMIALNGREFTARTLLEY